MLYQPRVKIPKQKKPRKVLLVLAITLTIIASYLVYTLKLNEIYFTATYQDTFYIQKDDIKIDYGGYPGAVKVFNKDISFNNNVQQFPMASTVKIVTALSLIDKIGIDNLDKTLLLSDADTAITQSYIDIGGSVVMFDSGQTITYKKALEYLLIVSANNFADILVNRQFSSSQEYLKYANEWLRQNNLNNTVVFDSSGFSPKTITTPQDLVLLGELALNNDIVKNIVKQKQIVLPNGLIKSSTNLFLDSKYGEVVGIKTGHTDEAGYVFVTAITGVDKPIIISSTMQAPTRSLSQQNAISLVDQLGSSHETITIFAKDSEVMSINLPWSNNLKVYTKKDININNIGAKSINYLISLESFNKNTKPGQKIGDLTVFSELEQQVYGLYLTDDYPGISPWWLITHPIN